MKIRELYSEQFAGLHLDDPIRFTDGVNVVYGKNESGKSTLVNLISRTLFQNSRLLGAAGKKFGEQYFPVSRKGSAIAADSAEGKISLENEEGRYTLSKVWGADSGTRLKTPDGILLRDQKGIDEAMKEILTYGEGVYSELLFSSQKNTSEALEKMLDPAGMPDTKQEITDVVSRAFAESDGLSVDVIEKKISEKIDKLGSNWDLDRDAPKGKSTQGGGRWAKGVGEVLEAFYAREDAKKVLEELKDLERLDDQAAEKCLEKEKEAEEAGNRLAQYEKSAAALEKKQTLQKNLQSAETELGRMNDALRKWPDLQEKLGKAKKLKKELANRQQTDLYEKVCGIENKIVLLSAALSKQECPEDSEIRDVRQALRDIETQKNRLSKMNIRADVRMLGGNVLEVVSLKTGEPVAVRDGQVDIREAVKLTIPGVMEMQLAPADVDPTEAERKIADANGRIQAILGRYEVKDADELENLKKRVTDAQKELADNKEKRKFLLNGAQFSELKDAYVAIQEEPRLENEIRSDIGQVCGKSDISGFIGSTENQISNYETDYGDIASLKEAAARKSSDMDLYRKEMEGLPEIPVEYLTISDPQQYLQNLKDDLQNKRDALAEAQREKTTTLVKLETCQNQQTVDPGDELEKTEREFREKKELLTHWIRIRNKLAEQKEKIEEHPLTDLTEQFSGYLNMITGGRVSSDQPDSDKLNVDIISNQRPMSYSLLSEGTKDTVSLAFRLAVVDHLFPEGGGVIVLDDPLTDMDEERVDQACALIRKCAERHQVIFLTCREEYQEKLQGTLIRIG